MFIEKEMCSMIIEMEITTHIKSVRFTLKLALPPALVMILHMSVHMKQECQRALCYVMLLFLRAQIACHFSHLFPT